MGIFLKKNTSTDKRKAPLQEPKRPSHKPAHILISIYALSFVVCAIGLISGALWLENRLEQYFEGHSRSTSTLIASPQARIVLPPSPDWIPLAQVERMRQDALKTTMPPLPRDPAIVAAERDIDAQGRLQYIIFLELSAFPNWQDIHATPEDVDKLLKTINDMPEILSIETVDAMQNHQLRIRLNIAPYTGRVALENVANSLRQQPSVSSVETVRRQKDGTIAAELTWHTPCALIEHPESGVCLINKQGTLIFSQPSLQNALSHQIFLPHIQGIRTRPPALGEYWEDPELLAAVAVADALQALPELLQPQMHAIMAGATNETGNPVIRLHFKKGGMNAYIIWGYPPNNTNLNGLEASTEQKVAHIIQELQLGNAYRETEEAGKWLLLNRPSSTFDYDLIRP